jgi:nickel-dependent lactate racemase
MTNPRAIALRYGRGRLECALPACAQLLTVREPEHCLNRASFLAGLHRLLPSALPPGPIAVVVADKTRLCGYPTALPWLTEALSARGADPSRIVFYIAYGVHARQSDAESLAAYGSTFADYRFIHHNSADPELFAELGRTSRGTPVRIRRDLLKAGLILTVGAISHHYFAGFGGGRKLLFPGLGEREAIFCNHRLFLDPRLRDLAPGCRPGQTEGNPLAEDLAEINQLLPPYLSLHGLLDSRGRVADFRFGASYDDFIAVCREHDAFYRAEVDAAYDLALASAGGYPKDINLIQAHKAIDNAAAFVRDGGELIILAECADGVGSSTFLPYFELGGREAAFDRLLADYSGNGGTALAMMTKTNRVRIALVTDLDPSLCQRIGVTRITWEEACRRIAAAPGCAVIANGSMLVRRTPPGATS